MQDELKKFREETLKPILKRKLSKVPSYYGEEDGERVYNEITGLEFPQILEFMEQKKWIRKRDGAWCIVHTEQGISQEYKRFRDLRNRLIASESRIIELKQEVVDNSELPLK